MGGDAAETAVKVLGLTAAAAAAYYAYTRVFGKRKRTRVIGVIPARYASTRFPGKPLVPIAGKPMILRTYEQAKQAKTLTRLVVATDDEKIRKACEEYGAEVIMTSEECPNGTERANEAVAKLSEQYDIVVNIQGDEPLMEPEIIDAVVRALQESPDAVYSTAVTPLKHEEVTMRARVKCILDQNGYAVYFSRGMLPYNKKGEVDKSHKYLLHLGLQCYDRDFLRLYGSLPATPLQLQEDLEQLKVLEHGYKIRVVEVEHSAHGVDEPEDVASIEKIMKTMGLK